MSNYRYELLSERIRVNTAILILAIIGMITSVFMAEAIISLVSLLVFAGEMFYISILRDAREGWTVFYIDPETGEEVEEKVYPRI